MKTPSLQHPSTTQGLLSMSSRFHRGCQAGQELNDEMSAVIDGFRALDGSPADLNKADNQVLLRSPKGRHETSFTAGYRVEEHSYRDREGYWETYASKILTGASYQRVEFGSDGKPNRKVTLSLTKTWDGDSITKTVIDGKGTSVASHHPSRGYEVNFQPDATIDSTPGWLTR